MRSLSSKALHGIPGKFDRDRRSADLTSAQEWLYDACVSELEYRRRRARHVLDSCSCRYCVPPFEFED